MPAEIILIMDFNLDKGNRSKQFQISLKLMGQNSFINNQVHIQSLLNKLFKIGKLEDRLWVIWTFFLVLTFSDTIIFIEISS